MTNAEMIQGAAEALSRAIAACAEPRSAFVGLDGFIDEIVHVVDKRQDFQHYTPIRTIGEYAARLAQAAGQSTNVELVLQQVKMGGNGPLLSDALGRLGVRVTSAGALGKPVLHPVFERLVTYGRVVSLTQPAVTIAAEFNDGKIMHGKLESLNDITYELLAKAFEGRLLEELSSVDLVALVNWTMIPNLTEVWRELADRLLDSRHGSPRFFFFDLCDPQKRCKEDQRIAIETIARFSRVGGLPILGLNEKESAEICAALGIKAGGSSMQGMIDRARRISTQSGIPEVIIHPRSYAVAVNPGGEFSVEGPVCESPKLTTGAGDSFNGGYCLARMNGLGSGHAITIGKAVSGYYVREGRAPNISELLRFAERWSTGDLDRS